MTDKKPVSNWNFLKIKSYVFPKNHYNDPVLMIISTFDRNRLVGKCFVEKIYNRTFFLEPERIEQKLFNNEKELIEYHDFLMKKYYTLMNKNIIKEDEKNEKKQEKRLANDGRRKGKRRIKRKSK